MTREVHIMVHCDKCKTSKWVMIPEGSNLRDYVTGALNRDGWHMEGDGTDLCPRCKSQEYDNAGT